MDENQNNSNSFNVSSEDLKKETKETVNEVKNTIKNVDFKKDSQAAKGFISEFFKEKKWFRLLFGLNYNPNDFIRKNKGETD